MSETVDVDANCSGSISVDGEINVGTVNADVYSHFAALPIKRPYIINPNHIEYIEGDWNSEKTEYGIRIGYTSGTTRCFWGDTGRKVLDQLVQIMDWYGSADEGQKLLKKFDERVKAGSPKVKEGA